MVIKKLSGYLLREGQLFSDVLDSSDQDMPEKASRDLRGPSIKFKRERGLRMTTANENSTEMQIAGPASLMHQLP